MSTQFQLQLAFVEDTTPSFQKMHRTCLLAGAYEEMVCCGFLFFIFYFVFEYKELENA